MIHLVSQGTKYRRNGISPFMFYLEMGMRAAGIPYKAWTMRKGMLDEILASPGPKVLVHTNYEDHSVEDQQRMLDAGWYLVLHGMKVVAHCPVLTQYPNDRIFTIRDAIVKAYPGSRLLPHPMSAKPIPPARKHRGMSFARVTSRKGIELLMEANLFLRKDPIQIRGEVNRIYAYHALRKNFGMPPWPGFLPDKEMAYDFGATPDLAASTEIAFNLTKPMHNDGGGTEYGTLYAMAAGCIPVVAKGWVDLCPTPMDDYVYTVDTVEDIVHLMKDRSITVPPAYDYLRKYHSPRMVAQMLADFLSKDL